MNTKFTIDELSIWIRGIIASAELDVADQIFWFVPTMNSPFSIIAGWHEYFSDVSEVDDMFCISASNPKYVMCIKVVENKGPYAYTEYELMNTPTDPDTGDVDDNEIMLEWEDDPDALAEFFLTEWERIMEEHSEEI